MSENKHTPVPWSRITAPGQVKPGDKLRFTIGDAPYIETAKEILFKGTDREEIIYNKRRNYYLITSMCMANQGSQKNVHFLSVETIESVKKQRDELLTDRDTWKSRAEFSYQQRDVLEGRASLAEAQRDELLAALQGLHKICEIALSGKDGQQHTYFETRAGHFVEATAAMQAAEAAIAGAPDNLRSFSLRFDRGLRR